MKKIIIANKIRIPIIDALEKKLISQEADGEGVDFLIFFECKRDSSSKISEFLDKGVADIICKIEDFRSKEVSLNQELRIVIVMPYLESIFIPKNLECLCAEILSLAVRKIFKGWPIVHIFIDKKLYLSDHFKQSWLEALSEEINDAEGKYKVIYFGSNVKISRFWNVFFTYCKFIGVMSGILFVLTRIFWSKINH